ncbi:MAG: hypothetical protein Q9214_007923, partial [Letrouitia sp. 1 TL-2023]
MFIDNDPPSTSLYPRPLRVGQPKEKLESRDDESTEPPSVSLPNSMLRIQTKEKGDGDCDSEAKVMQAPGARSVSVSDLREDCIRDTVGAIAVDCLGNIAAASSSGGIGMKHKGRVGPAALVGIGTAVIPVDSEDPQKTSVATVTSGTGEHMATTMAASTCASRLYTLTRKSQHGGSEATDEDSAIKAFVERDFMVLLKGHPSVKTSYSAGAIGVLGIRKTIDGVYMYFAHNTDSFAIASMSSEEGKPKSVMSRNNNDSKVVSGGRVVKHRRVSPWPTGHRSTWPTHPDASLSPNSQPTNKRQKRKRVPVDQT